MKVSVSKVRLFKACRRAYELRYVEGLIPVQTSDALETGRSYHSYIEQLYTEGSIDMDSFSKSLAMAKAYEKYIYPYLRMQNVEQWIECELCEEHSLIGRIDGMTEDGRLVEHKTTSYDLESYEFNLERDEQILAYMLASGIQSMVYTIIRKPIIRIKKNESEEEFFQRMISWYDEDTQSKIKCVYIYRSYEDIEAYRKELIGVCNEMERGFIYRNTAYCNKWGTLCEFAQVCNHYDTNEEYVNFRRRQDNADNEIKSDPF